MRPDYSAYSRQLPHVVNNNLVRRRGLTATEFVTLTRLLRCIDGIRRLYVTDIAALVAS
jgi:hypothetical protein